VDIFIGTEPSDEELALAEANGVKLTITPVCYDAFVFIVHKDNPIESLTVEQIRSIYAGEICYWSDVGIDVFEEEDADMLRAYTRQRNSGSQTAMENLVMNGKPMAEAMLNVYQVYEMSTLVRHVGEYENGTGALGYTYKFYINTLYKDEGIKTIGIDGIEPTEENIRSGVYPFATCYYAVTREGENEEFVQWMKSEEGQKCIQQAGYMPYMAGV
jgi:ABC-type phosphate transport system, periplasmic component